MPSVVIDGVAYYAASSQNFKELKEAQALAGELYRALWSEAFYDPTNDGSHKLASDLVDRARRLHELLRED